MVSFHRMSRTVNKTYHVVAFYKKDETSERYTVLKGSTIAPWNAKDETRKESGIISKYLCAMREKWATSSTRTLPEDVPSFNSPSQAAMFVTGNKAEPVQSLWKPVTEENYRNFLEKVPPSQTTLPPPSNPNIFHLDGKTADKYKVREAKFEIPVIRAKESKTIVREGSPIALQEQDVERMRKTKERRQKWFTEHPGQNILNEKVEFDSPTDAVQFVTGHHMSGPAVMVRETDGKTLAEITKTLRDAQKQAKGKESLS